MLGLGAGQIVDVDGGYYVVLVGRPIMCSSGGGGSGGKWELKWKWLYRTHVGHASACQQGGPVDPLIQYKVAWMDDMWSGQIEYEGQ